MAFREGRRRLTGEEGRSRRKDQIPEDLSLQSAQDFCFQTVRGKQSGGLCGEE